MMDVVVPGLELEVRQKLTASSWAGWAVSRGVQGGLGKTRNAPFIPRLLLTRQDNRIL